MSTLIPALNLRRADLLAIAEDNPLEVTLDCYLEMHRIEFTFEMLASLELTHLELMTLLERSNNDSVRQTIRATLRHTSCLSKTMQHPPVTLGHLNAQAA